MLAKHTRKHTNVLMWRERYRRHHLLVPLLQPEATDQGLVRHKNQNICIVPPRKRVDVEPRSYLLSPDPPNCCCLVRYPPDFGGEYL